MKDILPLMKVEQLSVHYGGIHALKALDFEVFPGEIISLIGANGAGKSTTLRAVSGLIPYQGKVSFGGQDISQLPVHKRVGLGLAHAPEGRGVFAQMTVLENLELGAYLRVDREQIRKDIDHCFALFPRLKERIKQAAGTLSGGEQQMLAISRAIMTKPKLLMLDEPSLGLAPQIVAQIFGIIKTINAEGVTVLLVEQNARMALKISQRAYVIETGKVVMHGKGEDLLNDDEVRKSYLGI